MEMVFVLDCSGSMNGRPLEQAKNAVSAALDNLDPGDTFQIIRFSENSSQFGTTPIPRATKKFATAPVRFEGEACVAGGTASG